MVICHALALAHLVAFAMSSSQFCISCGSLVVGGFVGKVIYFLNSRLKVLVLGTRKVLDLMAIFIRW